jgi:hypothetical protein
LDVAVFAVVEVAVFAHVLDNAPPRASQCDLGRDGTWCAR